jgi:hypothetical protein
MSKTRRSLVRRPVLKADFNTISQDERRIIVVYGSPDLRGAWHHSLGFGACWEGTWLVNNNTGRGGVDGRRKG